MGDKGVPNHGRGREVNYVNDLAWVFVVFISLMALIILIIVTTER